jgi:hypothetical protein
VSPKHAAAALISSSSAAAAAQPASCPLWPAVLAQGPPVASGLRGWYVGDSYNATANRWMDISGLGNHAVTGNDVDIIKTYHSNLLLPNSSTVQSQEAPSSGPQGASTGRTTSEAQRRRPLFSLSLSRGTRIPFSMCAGPSPLPSSPATRHLPA